MSDLPTYIRVGGALYKLGGEAEVKSNAANELRELIGALVALPSDSQLKYEVAEQAQTTLRPVVNKLLDTRYDLLTSSPAEAASTWKDARDALPGVIVGLREIMAPVRDPAYIQDALRYVQETALKVDGFMSALEQVPQRLQADTRVADDRLTRAQMASLARSHVVKALNAFRRGIPELMRIVDRDSDLEHYLDVMATELEEAHDVLMAASLNQDAFFKQT